MLSSAEASSGIQHQALQTLIYCAEQSQKSRLRRCAEPFHPCVR